MSLPQQPDSSLGDVSELPLELLQTLTTLIESGEPFDAGQTFEGLTAVTQTEILARLQALHEPAPPGDVPVPTEADGQPAPAAQQGPKSPYPPALPEQQPGLASTGLRPNRRVREAQATAELEGQPEGAQGQPQQTAGQAQARGPVYTEGSDAESPYNPPPRARQRISSSPAKHPLPQPLRQLPQVCSYPAVMSAGVSDCKSWFSV